jgi:hypothetical protein
VTNFILRIKEQETRLTLHEHDDDDDDDCLFEVVTMFLSVGVGSKHCLSHLVNRNSTADRCHV